jgi:hypothetical protein
LEEEELQLYAEELAGDLKKAEEGSLIPAGYFDEGSPTEPDEEVIPGGVGPTVLDGENLENDGEDLENDDENPPASSENDFGGEDNVEINDQVEEEEEEEQGDGEDDDPNEQEEDGVDLEESEDDL